MPAALPPMMIVRDYENGARNWRLLTLLTTVDHRLTDRR